MKGKHLSSNKSNLINKFLLELNLKVETPKGISVELVLKISALILSALAFVIISRMC